MLNQPEIVTRASLFKTVKSYICRKNISYWIKMQSDAITQN